MTEPNSANSPLEQTRRTFLMSSIAGGASLSLTSIGLGKQANKNSRLKVLQIGTGGIGQLDRGNIQKHPQVEFSGFCDVDKNSLNEIAAQFPGAFKVTDYREAFSKFLDQFDAVIVDTPDFHHAPMMITALKHHKHVYGQKPIVHQLDELRLLKKAIKKRPKLITQMGNQRASNSIGRRQALKILKSNQLGKPVKAYAWGEHIRPGSHSVAPWGSLPEPEPIPEYLNWDLWNGPLKPKLPYSPQIAPKRWRGYWETGGGMLADWGCHILDILYYAYDLPSPLTVKTETKKPSNESHSAFNKSTLIYPGGERFARDKFVLQYADSEIRPSFKKLGLPQVKLYVNEILIICEEGAILLGDLGKINIFRDGKEIKNEPLPSVPPQNHWFAWVDRCLGKTVDHWSPFDMGIRITEPALLATKATRFPGETLKWDSPKFRFEDHEQANRTILKRNYREGFAPPKIVS